MKLHLQLRPISRDPSQGRGSGKFIRQSEAEKEGGGRKRERERRKIWQGEIGNRKERNRKDRERERKEGKRRGAWEKGLGHFAA